MWPDGPQTEELLNRVRDGDGEAINQLLDRHREALRRLVAQRMDPVLQRRVDASDIVQDVMVEANRRLKNYLNDPAMPFHLWLRHMAKDRLIDAHRRHRVAKRRSLDREQPLVAAGPPDRSTVEPTMRPRRAPVSMCAFVTGAGTLGLTTVPGSPVSISMQFQIPSLNGMSKASWHTSGVMIPIPATALGVALMNASICLAPAKENRSWLPSTAISQDTACRSGVPRPSYSTQS